MDFRVIEKLFTAFESSWTLIESSYHRSLNKSKTILCDCRINLSLESSPKQVCSKFILEFSASSDTLQFSFCFAVSFNM